MIATRLFLHFIPIVCIGIDSLLGNPLIGGVLRSATPNEFPFVAAIATKSSRPTSTPRPFCAGTIITKKHVLTTAHCLTRKHQNHIRILAGSPDLTLCDEYGIKSWVSYNNWAATQHRSAETKQLIIAIITLSMPIDGERAKPVLLSPKTANHFYGLTGTVVGWGSLANAQLPSVLQVGKLDIFAKSECKEKSISQSLMDAAADDKVLCTADYPLLAEEDEGGPFLYGNNILVGINLASSLEIQQERNLRLNYHLNPNNYRRFIYDITAGEQLQIA